MSVWTRGLPSSFFSRRNAILVGLSIAVIFIIVSNIVLKTMKHVSEPRTAPACYGRAHVPGTKTIPGGPINPRLLVPQDNSNSSVTAALESMKVCQPQSCPHEAWKTYRSAIKSYVFDRLQNTSRLYREYGDVGLREARQMYRKPADNAIVEGLQARYKASVFRLNDFNQYHAAITILTLKGSDALRPCHHGESVED